MIEAHNTCVQAAENILIPVNTRIAVNIGIAYLIKSRIYIGNKNLCCLLKINVTSEREKSEKHKG